MTGFQKKITLNFNKIFVSKLGTLLKQKFPTTNITIIYADFSPRIVELQNIPMVKAYKIKYRHHGPQAEPNQQLVIEEFQTIFKDTGIPI